MLACNSPTARVPMYRQERGATYLFVMLAVVLMGISVTVAAKQWKAVVQREQEAELLGRGVAAGLETGIQEKEIVACSPKRMGTAPAQ